PNVNVNDEIFKADGKVRYNVRPTIRAIDELNIETLHEKQNFVDASFLKSGITFTVYRDSKGTEKKFPYDLIPRIIS
ncbi:circularly permuted type 2 ATP-grasp protein, partial [Francisella tularensis subsp. holarctica]|nr:circularly permuted type 2 ATP-grasp protein [Francisella tularensis subsp. holarctica]